MKRRRVSFEKLPAPFRPNAAFFLTVAPGGGAYLFCLVLWFVVEPVKVYALGEGKFSFAAGIFGMIYLAPYFGGATTILAFPFIWLVGAPLYWLLHRWNFLGLMSFLLAATFVGFVYRAVKHDAYGITGLFLSPEVEQWVRIGPGNMHRFYSLDIGW